MSQNNSKTALVIGAGDQVGADLVPALILRGFSVRLFDHLPVEKTSAYPKLVKTFSDEKSLDEVWTIGDAASDDLITFLKENPADQIHHLAAILSANGEKNPELCWNINMKSLQIILEHLRFCENVKKTTLIWPSSIAAFGQLYDENFSANNPTKNEYPLLPKTIYGITKAAGELLGMYYHEKFGVDFRSVRFPGLINSTPPGGGSTDFAPQMYFDAVAGRKSNCFVRPDTQLPFLYMDDAIKALTEISVVDSNRLTRRVYNLNGISPTAQDFEISLKKHFPSFQVKYNPDFRQKIVDSWPKALDESLAVRDWGWRVDFELDKITLKMIENIQSLQNKVLKMSP